MTDAKWQVPKGLVVMTSHGSVRQETTGAWGDSRAFFAANGITNVTWQIVPGALVDKTRNEAVVQMLGDPQAQFLLMIDADMTWRADAPLQLIERAFNSLPIADIIGGWCPLRGWPYLPTIDPGSGTWEPVAPMSGVIEVMRTGGAFVLIKRHVFERMSAPWYHVNFAPKALDALQAVETYALTKFDGRNPLRGLPEWALLEKCALEESQPQANSYPYQHIGEDSGFADKARALGFRIWVDTDVVVNHVESHIITADKHLEAMRELRENEAYAAGVLEPV